MAALRGTGSTQTGFPHIYARLCHNLQLCTRRLGAIVNGHTVLLG